MYQRILHATDLSDNHYHMCQKAIAIAKHFHAPLYLLHVIETPPTVQIAQGLGFTSIANPEPLKMDAESVLRILGEDLNIPVECQFVRIGSVQEQIKAIFEAQQCDLLIMGKHYHAFFSREEHFDCDILTLT